MAAHKGVPRSAETKAKISATKKHVKLKPRHREAIKVAMLLRKLHLHVEGKVELTPTQMRAAEVLLKKSMPDLQAVVLTGEDGGPVEHNITATMDNEVATKLYMEIVQGNGD